MDMTQIINQADAFDSIFEKKASHTSTKQDRVSRKEIEKKAELFDQFMGQYLVEKAAAYDILAEEAINAGYEVSGIEKAAGESHADFIMKKVAAYDDLVAEIQTDIILEKAAAFDQATGNKYADKVEPEELVEKAALYDELLAEAEADALVIKAAAFEKIASELDRKGFDAQKFLEKVASEMYGETSESQDKQKKETKLSAVDKYLHNKK